MWLSNPAASPAFFPTAASAAGLLLALLGAIAVAEGGRLRGSTLFRRWLTSAALAPLYALGVLSGPLVAWLFVSALSVQAVREYGALVDLPTSYRRALVCSASLAAGVALLGAGAHAAPLPLLLLLATTLLPLLGGDARAGVRPLALATFGWWWLPWLLSHLLLIQRDVPRGPEVLLALGLAVALSDVGAYVLGRRFGYSVQGAGVGRQYAIDAALHFAPPPARVGNCTSTSIGSTVARACAARARTPPAVRPDFVRAGRAEGFPGAGLRCRRKAPCAV